MITMFVKFLTQYKEFVSSLHVLCKEKKNQYHPETRKFGNFHSEGYFFRISHLLIFFKRYLFFNIRTFFYSQFKCESSLKKKPSIMPKLIREQKIYTYHRLYYVRRSPCPRRTGAYYDKDKDTQHQQYNGNAMFDALRGIGAVGFYESGTLLQA